MAVISYSKAKHLGDDQLDTSLIFMFFMPGYRLCRLFWLLISPFESHDLKNADFAGFTVCAFILPCSYGEDECVFKISLKFSLKQVCGHISLYSGSLYDPGRITLFVLLFGFSFLY